MSDDSDPEQPTPLKKAKTSQDDYDHEISSQNWEMLSQQVAKIKQDVQNLNDRFQRENISDVLENVSQQSSQEVVHKYLSSLADKVLFSKTPYGSLCRLQ
eukprot:g68469.t1